MQELLFLSPSFKYRIWGKDKLKDFYPEITESNIGEAWIISAHENGPSEVLNGSFKGQTLTSVYKNNPHLFANIAKKEFPLLVKIIDANDRLSVQVHPNDNLARKFNSYGKTECWYVLDAKPGAEIIYGHNALTKEEFIRQVEARNFNDLLVKKQVKKGDFFFIPAGVVHAIGNGILIFEIQQSSDITYRLYDYDRVDRDGKKRDLHLELGIEATTIPSPLISNEIKEVSSNKNTLITLIETEYFNAYKWELKNTFKTLNNTFTLMTFLEGFGTINGYAYKKGDSLIVPSTYDIIEISPDSKTEVIVATL